MAKPDFFWDYLPFWIANYGLAILVWTCVGRWMMQLFMPSLQPSNYIWRVFLLLTNWVVAAVGYITPTFVRPGWLPLLAAYWLYALRIVLFLWMARIGMAPLPSAVGG